MKWLDVRRKYPNQWLIIEATRAHTTPENQRVLDTVKVIERCVNGADAMRAYRRLHEQQPERELYFAHTSRERLEVWQKPLLSAWRVEPILLQ